MSLIKTQKLFFHVMAFSAAASMIAGLTFTVALAQLAPVLVALYAAVVLLTASGMFNYITNFLSNDKSAIYRRDQASNASNYDRKTLLMMSWTGSTFLKADQLQNQSMIGKAAATAESKWLGAIEAINHATPAQKAETFTKRFCDVYNIEPTITLDS